WKPLKSMTRGSFHLMPRSALQMRIWPKLLTVCNLLGVHKCEGLALSDTLRLDTIIRRTEVSMKLITTLVLISFLSSPIQASETWDKTKKAINEGAEKIDEGTRKIIKKGKAKLKEREEKKERQEQKEKDRSP